MSDTSKCEDCGRAVIVTDRDASSVVVVCRSCDYTADWPLGMLSADDPVLTMPITELVDTEEWRHEIAAAFGREHEDEPGTIVVSNRDTQWYVETGRRYLSSRGHGPWHKTYEVHGKPGGPITFVEI